MSWSDLSDTVCDVSANGRRARVGYDTRGCGVAEVGGEAPEVRVVDSKEFDRRAPGIERLDRLAGLVMPGACIVAPRLNGDPAEVVRNYVEGFKNQRRFFVFPRTFSSRFVHHFEYGGNASGWSSWIATGRAFLTGFPDVQVEIVDLIAEGEWVVEHNVARGQHLGPFRGVAPTGLPVEWREVHAYRVTSGRIVENWPFVDLASIFSVIDSKEAA